MSLSDHPRCEEMNALIAKGNLNDAEIAELIAYAVETGGIRYAEERMKSLRDKAAAVLRSIVSEEAAKPLLTLLDYIIERDL